MVGPDGPKRYLFPSHLRLFEFHIEADNFVLDVGPPQVPKLAMLGVRACELAAIEVQDRVFGMDDPRVFRCETEPWYTQIRQETLMIAVNCTRPSGTCFCSAWGTGPEATQGFDLALTELRDGFLVQVGSKRGMTLVEELPVREPTQAEEELAAIKLERARDRMGRQLDTAGLKELLDESIEYPEWDEIAHRCLSCGNCTMVCPTCFCCTVTDTTNLAATQADHPHAAMGVVFHAPVHLHDFRTGAEHDPRPVPALAAAQAQDVVGAIRMQRLRGLRALHHLVSCRH